MPSRFAGRTAHGKSTRLHPNHVQTYTLVKINQVIGAGRLALNIGSNHRKDTFGSGITFVLGLYTDGIGRGIGFVIEGGCGLEGTVGIEGKEGIIGIPSSQDQGVSQDRTDIRIGGVKFTYDCSNGLGSRRTQGEQSK